MVEDQHLHLLPVPLEATFKARDSQPWDPARVEVDFECVSVDKVGAKVTA